MPGCGPSPFFGYAIEREQLRRRRLADAAAVVAGEAPQGPPWTDDPVLQSWRFCNVFREHDRTTQWFRNAMRQPLRDNAFSVTFATFLFRWFNRIETGEVLREHHLHLPEVWDAMLARRVLKDLKPLVTGAYMVKTPNGLTKLEGILSCVEQTLASDVLVRASEARTLQACHAILTEAPFLGVFMAYEIVTDLRHTCVLEHADDILTWASPGPGAARGLDWIHGPPPGWPQRSYVNEDSRERMFAEMRELLALSRDPNYWPQQWGAWEMREVEHTLCEFDKYCRATVNGQQLKRKFNA